MIKFKITPDRVAEACNVLQFLALQGKSIETAIRVLPRFVVDEKGEYVIKVKLDDEGDISEIENEAEAIVRISVLTPKRLEKLAKELTEAVENIVNPPSGRDSTTPTSTG